MSTDRELLELAAKAAKLILGEFKGRTVRYESDGQPVYWNPLHFDDDALRLAVALRMQITIGVVGVGIRGFNCLDFEEYFTPNCDKSALTRRAIVRAAAEIGKAMP